MKRILIAVVGLSLLSSVALGQGNSDALAKLTKALHEKIGKEKPNWTHRSITPIEGSKNVIVEQWESGDLTIKVAVTEYGVSSDAAFAMKEFRKQLKTEENAAAINGKPALRLIKEELPELGDEGFAWDIRGSEAAAFRKGHFLVVISLGRPLYRTDVWSSKEFAKYVSDVIPAP